jgi:hypothetical protein
MNTTTIKTQIATLQAALTTAIASPAPNYSVSGPDGSRSISYADYMKSLIDQIGALQELLVECEPYIISTKVII